MLRSIYSCFWDLTQPISPSRNKDFEWSSRPGIVDVVAPAMWSISSLTFETSYFGRSPIVHFLEEEQIALWKRTRGDTCLTTISDATSTLVDYGDQMRWKAWSSVSNDLQRRWIICSAISKWKPIPSDSKDLEIWLVRGEKSTLDIIRYSFFLGACTIECVPSSRIAYS
jgi:hypothetical protein